MTVEDLAEAARRQNDRDFAAGRMPSRHVQDAHVLNAVATILLDAAEHQAEEGGGGRARSA